MRNEILEKVAKELKENPEKASLFGASIFSSVRAKIPPKKAPFSEIEENQRALYRYYQRNRKVPEKVMSRSYSY
ncbi:MAG: hypothetical protein LBF85_04960 [Tannerella sp.]|jgi:hypothetical protein|nr:hypothetical protein [Tannerella sp.]